MTSHERAFWSTLASSLTDGWDIRMAFRDSGAPAVPIGGVDHFIYVVDTHSAWRAAAGVTHAQVLEMAAIVRNMPAKLQAGVPSVAAEAIAQAAGKGATGEQSVDAAKAALAAFTVTQTYRHLSAHYRPGVTIHMVYMVYHCMDGQLVGRPVGAASTDPGLMPDGHLQNYIGQAVSADTSAGTTSVQQMLRDHGGPKLARPS